MTIPVFTKTTKEVSKREVSLKSEGQKGKEYAVPTSFQLERR